MMHYNYLNSDTPMISSHVRNLFISLNIAIDRQQCDRYTVNGKKQRETDYRQCM